MGKAKTLSLGSYPILTLSEARTKRDEAKRLLADGVDPSVQKKLDKIDAEIKARMTWRSSYMTALSTKSLQPNCSMS